MLEAYLVSVRSALTTVFYGIVAYGRPPFTTFEMIYFFVHHLIVYFFQGVPRLACHNAFWTWLLNVVLLFGARSTGWIIGTICLRYFMSSTLEGETTTPTVPSCSCRRNLLSIMRSNGVRRVHERGCGRERMQTLPNKTTTAREQKRVCKGEIAEIKREIERNKRALERLETKEEDKKRKEEPPSQPLFPHAVSRLFSDKLSLAEKTTVVSKYGVDFDPWEWTEVTVVEIRETTFYTDNDDDGVKGLEKIE